MKMLVLKRRIRREHFWSLLGNIFVSKADNWWPAILVLERAKISWRRVLHCDDQYWSLGEYKLYQRLHQSARQIFCKQYHLLGELCISLSLTSPPRGWVAAKLSTPVEAYTLSWNSCMMSFQSWAENRPFHLCPSIPTSSITSAGFSS
jgi:hypothetical protein